MRIIAELELPTKVIIGEKEFEVSLDSGVLKLTEKKEAVEVPVEESPEPMPVPEPTPESEVIPEPPVEEAPLPPDEPEEQPDEEEQMEDIPDEPIVIPPTPSKPEQVITTGYPYLNKSTTGGQGNYGSIPKGTVLTVLDSTKYYYKVTYKGNTGWVSIGYTKPYEPAKPEWEVKADTLIEDAISMIGKVKYVYSKNSPSTMEFDCSSWTKYLFNKHNIINLYWGARKQSAYGTKIEKQSDLRKGDLVFFNSKSNREKYPTAGDINRISHVGIYIGEGKFIHNLSPTYNVVISELKSSNWVIRYETACRVIK